VLDLTRIVEQANRAAMIIRRLQTFVRKNDLTRVEALLGRGIVAQLVPFLKAETQYHGVTLRMAGLDQEGPVSANVLEIQQVILILARNGIEAMARIEGDKRVLTIEVGPVVDREVEVAVCDAGVGFTAEAAERLFDPFYTTRPDGVGLGLSVARTIVEEHGGRLYATQNREAGVTFRMTLPVRGKGGSHGT
jgi:C4-dicarboxylate-specific signal transduction histidine kinase